MKPNKTYEKCKANIAPETMAEVQRNTALLNEFLADYDEDATLLDAILWGMQKQKAELTDKACAWIENYLIEMGILVDDWCRDSKVQESGEKRFRKAIEE